MIAHGKIHFRLCGGQYVILEKRDGHSAELGYVFTHETAERICNCLNALNGIPRPDASIRALRRRAKEPEDNKAC